MTKYQEGAENFKSIYGAISAMPAHNPYIYPGLKDGGGIEHILWSGEWFYDPVLGSIAAPTVGYVTLEQTPDQIIIARRSIYLPPPHNDDDFLEARMTLRQVGPGRNVEFLEEPFDEIRVPDRADVYLATIKKAVEVARRHPDRVVRVR